MGDVMVDEYPRHAGSRDSRDGPLFGPEKSDAEEGEEASGYESEGASYIGNTTGVPPDGGETERSSQRGMISALQLQNEALQAQIRDLTQKLVHTKRDADETDKMCESLRQDLLEETEMRTALEMKMVEYEEKMVESAGVAIEQDKKRMDDENAHRELKADVEKQRWQLSEQKACNEDLKSELALKDEELQTLRASFLATEEALKSKRRIDDTWELVHRDDRNKIKELEEEMQRLRKENIKLPIMRQQLTHAETQAREMLESMNVAIRKESAARSKWEEAEMKLDKFTELQEMLESERASYEREKMSSEVERATRELSDKKLSELERLTSERETTIKETQDALEDAERKYMEEKNLRELAIGELRECKEKYLQVCNDFARVSQENALKGELKERHAEDLENAVAELSRLREENLVLASTKQQLVQAEKQVKEALEDSLASKRMAHEARRIAEHAQATEQASVYNKESLLSEFESEKNNLLRELDEERDNSRRTKSACSQMEERIAYLVQQLDVKNAEHEAAMRAKTLAETALSAIEDRRHLRVDRGCSPMLDEGKLELKNEIESLRATNNELTTHKMLAERRSLRCYKEIDRMKQANRKIAEKHRILREDYRRHMELTDKLYETKMGKRVYPPKRDSIKRFEVTK